jgi:hypothetical protein
MAKRPTISELAAQGKQAKSRPKQVQMDQAYLIGALIQQIAGMRAWGDKAAHVLGLAGYQHLVDEWREARKG